MKVYCTLLFACLSSGLFAQTNFLNKSSKFAKPSRDNAMMQIGYEAWSNTPDSVKTKGFGRAFNAYMTYDFPIQKSNFSFSGGLGIGVSNIFFDDQQLVFTDTNGYIRFIPETQTYKKYKLTTAYLEAPFELRYYSDKVNRNKGIKLALGLKVGTLLSAHTKGKRTFNNKPIIEKTTSKRYLESYRYSLTGRIGYGNFSVYGSYALSNVFKINQGPENVKPIQIGICISGL